MPVHTSQAGSARVLVVDGDYTQEELQRVAAEMLAAEVGTRPVRLLLDLSGAASLAARSDVELRATAAFFAARGAAIDRVAILVRGDMLDDLMRMGTAFAVQDGLRASPFRDREAALDWLDEPGD